MPAIETFEDWVGRSESAEDILTPRMAAHMAASLGAQDAGVAPGDPLPVGWQWMVCAEGPGAGELARDGLPERGGLLPPIDLPRRMWAGGNMRFHQPLRIGETVRLTTEVKDITFKQGRSGALAFVALGYAYSGEHGLAIEEQQSVVYRAEKQEGEAPPPAVAPPAEAVWRRTIKPDPVLLFRYSALTFNSHRIHYDQPYATNVEGYPGLLVHGPLIATLLFDLMRRNTDKAPAQLSYRAMRPLFDTAPFEVCGAPGEDGKTCTLWALDPEGAVAMQVEVGF
ncbi:MAG: FAS1-like dehydratase domain-containing protein [Alphaproteobacteria bacterium]